MAVPREVIEEIRSRLDIVQLVGEVVPLKKVGRNFVGRCPFHEEKTPSFSVSAEKQLYHCFGCGEGGTVLTFMMKFHHLNFPETLERLAPIAGIDLKKFESRKIAEFKIENRRLIRVTNYARDLYHRYLLQSEGAQAARDYAKKRGLSESIIRDFQLGYAPNRWDALCSALERDGLPLDDAVRVGLVAKKDRGGYYDVFRDRLLFPIVDVGGNTIGFGGRTIADGTPKYLNSPQTVLFDKSRTLFGIDRLDRHRSECKEMIVVEGYMDYIALAANGIANVVATLGTAFTEEHAKIIGRYADRVTFLFDGDAAGQKAARRAMGAVWARGLSAHIAVLPSGEDPDVYIRRHGKDHLLALVSRAPSALNAFIDQYVDAESDVVARSRNVQELVLMLRNVSNVILREAMIAEISTRTGMDAKVLRGEGSVTPLFPRFEASKRVQVNTNRDVSVEPSKEELTIMRLAAEEQSFRERVFRDDVLALFAREEFASHIQSWLSGISAREDQSAQAPAMIEDWPDETTRPALARIFMDEAMDIPTMGEKIWEDCVRKLRNRCVKRLKDRVSVADRAGNKEEVTELLRRMEQLKRMDTRPAEVH